MTVAAGVILGVVLGSFAKAAAERLVRNKTLLGRSYCPSCKHKLGWYDLFPILSFIFLRGRCRYCQRRIPADDFLTEVVLGLIIALLVLSHPLSDISLLSPLNWQTGFLIIDLIFKLFAVVILTIVFWVDLKTGLILDKVTYPASMFSAFYLVSLASVRSLILYKDLNASSLGKYMFLPYSDYFNIQIQRLWMGVGQSFLSAIGASLAFILLIVITRGKGMGWGDVKYVFFLGLVLGFPNILVGLFLAFLLGAVFSLSLIALNKKHFGQTIPFGPFLSLGALIAILYGTQILNWYLNGFKF